MELRFFNAAAVTFNSCMLSEQISRQGFLLSGYEFFPHVCVRDAPAMKSLFVCTCVRAYNANTTLVRTHMHRSADCSHNDDASHHGKFPLDSELCVVDPVQWFRGYPYEVVEVGLCLRRHDFPPSGQGSCPMFAFGGLSAARGCMQVRCRSDV